MEGLKHLRGATAGISTGRSSVKNRIGLKTRPSEQRTDAFVCVFVQNKREKHILATFSRISYQAGEE